MLFYVVHKGRCHQGEAISNKACRRSINTVMMPFIIRNLAFKISCPLNNPAPTNSLCSCPFIQNSTWIQNQSPAIFVCKNSYIKKCAQLFHSINPKVFLISLATAEVRSTRHAGTAEISVDLGAESLYVVWSKASLQRMGASVYVQGFYALHSTTRCKNL